MENLRLFGRLAGVRGPRLGSRLAETAAALGLTELLG
jgi:hypothetical protein